MQVLELAQRFVAAIAAGDEQGVRRYYAPDATIWHNFDNLEQSVDDNIASLNWLTSVVADRHYEIVRLEATADGFFQQHVLTGTLPDDSKLSMPACIICRVADGRITRLDEYLDPAPMMRTLRKTGR